MSPLPIRVVKVGCSLFERRQLPEQLRAWLQAQLAAVHILLPGGGELADSIRIWDRRFQLGEGPSHWLCVEALSLTAQVLQLALREFPLVRDYHELLDHIAHQQPGTVVFDVQSFLRDIEPAMPHPLPHTWQVTTDSIAARLAEVLAADELVLLKARPCPDLPTLPVPDFAALAAEGYVDEHFPQLAPRLQRVTLEQL